MIAASFYCVADERYFLGAVGLLNSLRLQGHREPLYVLDVGLTSEQRRLLEAQSTVIDAGADTPPWLAKTIAPRSHPDDVMVLIDVDMILTRSLGDLIERAAEGRIVAFENDRPRFVGAWEELLGLGPLERRTYVSSGLVALGGRIGRDVLELLDDRQQLVDIHRTVFGENDPDYPFLYPEQDVLNAILCSQVAGSEIVVLDNRLAPNPPFEGVRLLDLEAVRCAQEDGTEPYVLHHFHRKPWLEPMYHGLYSRLLARLLLGPEIALRVPTEMIPLRMRNGIRARAARAGVDAADVFRRYVLERGGST